MSRQSLARCYKIVQVHICWMPVVAHADFDDGTETLVRPGLPGEDALSEMTKIACSGGCASRMAFELESLEALDCRPPCLYRQQLLRSVTPLLSQGLLPGLECRQAWCSKVYHAVTRLWWDFAGTGPRKSGGQAAGRSSQDGSEDPWSHSPGDTWRHTHGVPSLPGPPLTLHQMRQIAHPGIVWRRLVGTIFQLRWVYSVQYTMHFCHRRLERLQA